MRQLHLCLLLLGMLLHSQANAQATGTREFGPYTVYYSVVNTTFISPQVAGHYGLVRAKDRAFINIAVRKSLDDGSDTASPARVEGRTWDLFHNQFLEFREVREQNAIYYIADFEFSSEDIRFFKVQLLPEGAERSYEFKFNHRVYEN
jgi:hypothetical protein